MRIALAENHARRHREVGCNNLPAPIIPPPPQLPGILKRALLHDIFHRLAAINNLKAAGLLHHQPDERDGGAYTILGKCWIITFHYGGYAEGTITVYELRRRSRTGASSAILT